MRLESTLSIPLLAPVSLPAPRVRLQRAFDDYYPGVWRFLRRMGLRHDRADDAAQQVFLIAIEAIDRIAPGSERAYLYATAVRVTWGIRRKGDREVFSTMDVDASPLPSPDELTDQKRARQALDYIVGQLDVDLRAVFVLAELDGFTTPEIAQLLELPLGTAASRLRRSREKFRVLVGQVYGEVQ